MPTTISEQVSRLAETTAAQPPDEITGAFTREQVDLAAKGSPVGIIEAGAILRDAELHDPHGATTSLYSELGDRMSVLLFYRGAWCPYCNIALNAYQGANCLDGAWDWWRSTLRPRAGCSASRRSTS